MKSEHLMYKYKLLGSLLFLTFSTLANASTQILPEELNVNYHIIDKIEGDFNGNGLIDIAEILSPKNDFFKSEEYEVVELWKGMRPNLTTPSLLITLDKERTYWIGSFDGRFTSPSFSLLLGKSSDYPEIRGVNSDVLILPSEAGIDEIIYIKATKPVLISPEEYP